MVEIEEEFTSCYIGENYCLYLFISDTFLLFQAWNLEDRSRQNGEMNLG